MKTKMRQTSLDAYNQLTPKLQPKEQSVLHAIKRLSPCSDQDISEYLLWPINCVTGRRNSLVKKGIVTHGKGKVNNYGRRVNTWILK